IFTLKGHTSPVWCVSFSPDGKRLATGSNTTVKVWEMATAKEIGTFKGHRSELRFLAYSPDGTRLASGDFHKNVKIWDATALEAGRTIKAHTDIIDDIAFSPDGKRLASASGKPVWDEKQNKMVKKPGTNQVHLWDVATGQPILSLKSPSGFGGKVVFS